MNPSIGIEIMGSETCKITDGEEGLLGTDNRYGPEYWSDSSSIGGAGLAGGYARGVYGGSGLERGGTMAFGARGGDLAVHDDLGPPGAQLRSDGSDGSVQVGPGDQGGDQGGA